MVKTCKSASLVDLGDDVFCLEFHTKMNAINGEIVDFMAEGLDYVDANGAGLVIGNQAGGMPGAFSAGGDLAFMAGWPRKGNTPRSTVSQKGPDRHAEGSLCQLPGGGGPLRPDPGRRL
jgi:enoyl-CoA hydratase/carnithine racemase